MRHVVVTGMGIVSAIGNNQQEVLRSLRQGRSGLRFVPQMQELGYRCHVAGLVKEMRPDGIDRQALQTMSEVARYAAVATREAITDAQVTLELLQSPRTGVVLGTGAGGINDVTRHRRLRLPYDTAAHVGPAGVVKLMTSTAALSIAMWLGVKGRCYAVSSACATGADNIGHGFELIRAGILDLCISGGADECGIRDRWGFGEALNALPVAYNDRPSAACRPYDRDRQGMVLSEGAGVIILEALEHAQRRGARIYAEVIGYGSANDGDNMFEPTGQGLRRCLREALATAQAYGQARIDYINPHGAGTRVGDPVEVQVIREVFGEPSPLVSSTKPLNGHSQGAVGAHEAIFTLLMLHYGFIVPTANLEHVAPECAGVRHVRAPLRMPIQTAMTFNAGLAGTNACLIFKKP